MTFSKQVYIEQMREAVKSFMYPPVSLVKVIFQTAKKAKQDELRTLEQRLEQHRKAAEEAVIEMCIRHQVRFDSAPEINKPIKHVRHDHE